MTASILRVSILAERLEEGKLIRKFLFAFNRQDDDDELSFDELSFDDLSSWRVVRMSVEVGQIKFFCVDSAKDAE